MKKLISLLLISLTISSTVALAAGNGCVVTGSGVVKCGTIVVK